MFADTVEIKAIALKIPSTVNDGLKETADYPSLPVVSQHERNHFGPNVARASKLFTFF
jgi:hypothetical protein